MRTTTVSSPPNESPVPRAVPADLLLLIRGEKAPMHAWFPHRGIMYSASSTHLGNSLVYFYPRGDRAQSPIPGSIKYIFERDGKTLFAVQRQLPLHHRIVDPFKPYIHFPVKLYSSSLADVLEVVHIDWIMCHFARWQMSPEHVAVLSLSRVCFQWLSVMLHLLTEWQD